MKGVTKLFEKQISLIQRNLYSRKRASNFIYFIAPAIILLVVFISYPFIRSIITSFYSWNLVKPQLGIKYIGLENYFMLFKDARFWNSVKISFIFVIGSVSISMFLGLLLALILHKPFKGNKFFRVLFLLPMFITPVVAGIMWRFMLDNELGIVNFFLGLFNVKPLPWLGSPSLALLSVIMVDVWEWTPLVFLLCLCGLESLPIEPFEAAYVDGATSWDIFKFITFPLMKPVLLSTIIIRTTDAFGVFDMIYVATKGGPGVATENLNLFAFVNAFEYCHIGYATTITLVLMIMVLFITRFYIKVMKVSFE